MIYWNLVEQCLVEFHFLTKEAANLAVNSYLARIDDAATREFAKHEEAFYLACALAGKEVREPTESESIAYNRLTDQLYKENGL